MVAKEEERKKKGTPTGTEDKEEPRRFGPPLVRVTRWWAAGDRRKRVTFLFLGDGDQLLDRPAAARFLEGGKAAATPSAAQRKELIEAFGEEGYASIAGAFADASEEVRFVKTVQIRRDDTMLAVRHKVAAALEMYANDEDQKVRIRDLYFWRRQGLREEEQARYVTDRLLFGLYAQHSVRSLHDLITHFVLARDGIYPSSATKKKEELVTSDQARRMLEESAALFPPVDATTFPMGLGHFIERRGDRRLFAHDPVRSLAVDRMREAATHVDDTRHTYDDDVKLWEYFHADATVYGFHCVLFGDAKRVMPADALGMYFPENEGDEEDHLEERRIREGVLSGSEAHTDLLRASHRGGSLPPVRLPRLKIRSLVVAGRSCVSADVVAAFSAIQTDAVVPVVRIHEAGGTDVFKLSRMAVHQQVVDPAWLGAWIREAKRTSAYDQRSHLTLAVRHERSDEMDVLVTVTEDGRVDVDLAFKPAYFVRGGGKGEPRQMADVSDVLSTVNAFVVAPLIRLQKSSHLRNGVSVSVADPCTQRFFPTDAIVSGDRDAPRGVTESLARQMPSPTVVVKAVAAHDVSVVAASAPTKKGAAEVKGRRPSVATLAALVNENKAEVGDYFSLAELVPADQGGGLNLYMFGAAGIPGNTASAEATRLQWSVAIRALQTASRSSSDADSSSFEERAARTLAPLFAVTLKEARRTVSDVLQHHIQRVTSRPGQILTPTLRVREFGATGFALQSHVVHNTATVRNTFRAFEALVDHASSSKANTTVSQAPPPPPPFPGTEAEGEAHPPPLVDDMLLMDDHIKELLSLEEAERPRQPPQQEEAATDEGSPDAGNNGMVLRALQNADPRLFSSKSNYPKMCGKVSDRQPIHLRAEELERISPDAYTTALRYGSTPEMAERNAYICPEVWCPVSRTPMTMKQYRDAGNKCPGGERAMVFDKPYWKGKEKRYPGFLPSWKHPEGMCMPCCFGLPNRGCDSSTFDGFHSGSREGRGEEEAEEEGGTEEKYIKRDHAIPLLDGRYGMMPKPMQHVFHRTLADDRGEGSPSSSSSRRRRDLSDVRASSQRRMVEGVCGSRPDGSGQFLKNMICYVRRGMPHSKQPFLTCVVHLMKPRVKSVRALTDLVLRHLSPLEYLGMEGGQLCRTFMDHDTVPGLTRQELFAEFFRVFTADVEYQKATGTVATADGMLRDGPDGFFSQTDPVVRREYMVFASLQRFKAYLADPGITKTHTMLLDLFNSGAAWLGRMPLLMVLETLPPSSPQQQQQSSSHWSQVSRAFSVRCGALRRALSSKPLKDGVSFICNTGDTYEPIIRIMNRRGLRYKDSLTSPTETEQRRRLVENKSAASPSVLESVVFSYDADPEVRRLVDEVRDVCRGKEGGAGGLVHTVAAVLTGVMGRRLKAQVLDYGFRVVGLVTREDVLVPTSSSAREPMLVGEAAPPHVMYLTEVTRLRPYYGDPATTAKRRVQDFYRTLASHLPDAGFEVMGEEHGALVLANGRVVPLAMTRVPPRYLDNFNILIGAQTADPRIVLRTREKERVRVEHLRARDLNQALLSEPEALREYSFLRDVMNPFPLWYKREAMRRLLRRLPLKEAAADAWDVDFLLLQGGPEADAGPVVHTANHSRTLIAMRNAFRDIGRGRNDRHDIIITNADIADNAWVTDIQRVLRNPLAPQTRTEGREDGDEGRGDCKRRARMVLEGLLTQRDILKKWETADAPSPRPETRPVGDAHRGSSSSDRRKLRSEGYVDIVTDCHVWHVFTAVAELVSIRGGGAWTTPHLTGRVLANSLVQKMTSRKEGKKESAEFFALLREHPVLGRHLTKRQQQPAVGRRRALDDAGPRDAELLDRLLTQIALYPSYVPGLLDVLVLSEHFRVHTRVWSVHSATALPASADARRTSQTGMSPSTLRRYPTQDYGAEHAPPSLHLMYVQDTHTFHVLLNGRRGLLHTA